ncbi:hypothetical protein PV327_001158 [Microctonus hyperodae]|uniref:Homeobox domain-containing protein n=1 Tax=Microctonus hyperodae TaxID=165561 RepID=A0AA39L346_MICHY|nr:hypothetical protein PV327_001158 [Microctonus hyperodae]
MAEEPSGSLLWRLFRGGDYQMGVTRLRPRDSGAINDDQIYVYLEEGEIAKSSVKVWFQNRRTKHKRVQQEEEAKAQQQSGGGNNANGNGNSNNKNTHHVSKWQQETGDYHHDDDEDDDGELIDPKAEDCSSGSEA